MKRNVFATLLVGALLLAACGPPSLGNEVGTEPMGTEPVGTEPMGTEPMGTEAATEADTEAGTEAATEAPTEASTEAEIPGTGELDPGVATALFEQQVEVHASDHTPVGTVDNLILDVEAGAIQYIVVATEDGALIAVPYDQVAWDEGGFFLLNVDVSAFEGAPAFEGGEIPDTQEPDWDADIAAYWSSL